MPAITLKMNALLASEEWVQDCYSISRRGFQVKSILLVEDSRFLRAVVERELVRAGYNVMSAGDGEEALRIAYTKTPDLVLLDMMLPKVAGPEVLRALRNNPVTASIPVIVLSSLAQTNEAKLLQEGASAYFEKSKIELDRNAGSLLQIVKRMLDLAVEKQVLSAN